jgi:hypothetical protein
MTTPPVDKKVISVGGGCFDENTITVIDQFEAGTEA